MNGCDRQAVDRYAAGSCTAPEVEAVEAHLITCASCEAYLEGLLEGAASHIDAGHQAVPPGVRRRLFKERSKMWRPVWAIAFAAVVVSVLLLRPPTLEATEVASTVRTSGRAMVAGAAVPSGSVLKMVGPGSIIFGELTVRSSAPINRFSLVKDAGRWRIKDPLFPVDLIHRGSRLVYGAQVGSMKIDPSGTRFRVWQDGFEVYASGVVATNGFGTPTTCVAGRRYVAGKLVPIDDDPCRFVADPLYPPSALRSWAEAGSPSFEIGPSREALVAIGQVDLSAPGALTRLAFVLARDFDVEDCVQVVRRAIDGDPPLKHLDDSEFAELLAFLVGFADDAGLARRVAGARGWSGMDDLLSGDLQTRIEAAKLGGRTATEPVRLAMVSSAVRAAIRSQVDTGGTGLDVETLRWAQGELERLLADGRLTKRGRATSLEVLAEAQYYVSDTQLTSLDTLRRSVDLWRTPERVAHLCARVSELSTPTVRDRSDLIRAFFADPTYRSAARVLTFLRDNSATPSDRTLMLEFARWIGDTYRSVPNAQAVAAEHLMDRSIDEALPYFEQAERLVDGHWSELDMQHGEAFAIALWRMGKYSTGDRVAAKAIADRCGLSSTPTGQSAYRFFLEAGFFDEALASLAQTKLTRADQDAERGRILKIAGRTVDAVDAFQRYLDERSGPLTDVSGFEATASIAELIRSSNPRRSVDLARSILAADLAPLERGWRRHRRYASLFRGRAYWLLGEPRLAIAELENYLMGAASEETKRPDRLRLRQWKASVTPSQALPRSSENRRTR